LSEKTATVQVKIKYKEIEQEFVAPPQEAWLLTNQFFKDFVPSFEIAQKLWLTIDLQQLAKDASDIVSFSDEGANLLVPKNKLTDNEALSVWLTAYYLGQKLGIIKNDSMSKDELQIKVGKSSKITSTRLGELAKNGMVQKTADDKFRITTYGVLQTQKEVIPRIKSKINF